MATSFTTTDLDSVSLDGRTFFVRGEHVAVTTRDGDVLDERFELGEVEELQGDEWVGPVDRAQLIPGLERAALAEIGRLSEKQSAYVARAYARAS